MDPPSAARVPPPRLERDDGEEKREITLEDFDGEESSNRLATGAAVAGAGAAVIGGAFGAKVLLDGQDDGNQEYIYNPDFMDSSASLNAPPNEAVGTAVAAGGAAAAGAVASEVGRRVSKFLEKTKDDHNDIDHVRHTTNSNEIVSNITNTPYTGANVAQGGATAVHGGRQAAQGGKQAAQATKTMDPLTLAR